MRHLSTIVATALAVAGAQVLLAQAPMKLPVPGAPGDPVWQARVQMSDGRTFVTDGGLAIDAALAKPAKLPERVVAGKVLESYMSGAHKEEYGFRDLDAAASSKTYTAPSGVALNATYINFLRRTLPASAVRFRISGGVQPVIVVADGKVVAVLMPVKQ